MTTIKFVNAETGEEIEREMTAEELAQHKKDIESIKEERKLEAERKAKKEALLERLGITEEEAKLLLS